MFFRDAPLTITSVYGAYQAIDKLVEKLKVETNWYDNAQVKQEKIKALTELKSALTASEPLDRIKKIKTTYQAVLNGRTEELLNATAAFLNEGSIQNTPIRQAHIEIAITEKSDSDTQEDSDQAVLVPQAPTVITMASPTLFAAQEQKEPDATFDYDEEPKTPEHYYCGFLNLKC